MPPKKPESALHKLKALQKAKKKKPEKITEITQKPRVRSLKDIKNIEKEEQEDRNFFGSILEIESIEKVLNNMERFRLDKNAFYIRKRLIENIFDLLPEDLELYHDFAGEYINQENQTLQEFWDDYQKRPVVAVAIREKIDMLDEKYRLEAIANDICDEDEEEDEIVIEEDDKVQVAPVVKTKKRTKLVEIQPDGTMVEVSVTKKQAKPTYVFGEDPQEKLCVSEYRKIPWINAMLIGIYIQPVDDNDLSMYINNNAEILDQGDEGIWFPVNKDFYYFVCGPKANFRDQEGDIMKATDSSNRAVFMKVGFMTNIGFIVQDQSIFENEKKYYRHKQKSLKEQINELRYSFVTNKLIDISKIDLSSQLHKIAPQVRDYGDDEDYNTEYISEIIEIFNRESTDVNSFLRKLGELVIYLEIDNTKILKERINQELYNPTTLAGLDIYEKFPEANLLEIEIKDPKESERTINILEKRLDAYVDNMLEYYYTILNAGKRKSTRADNFAPTRVIKTYHMKERCVNYQDVIDVPEDQVVYYEDFLDIYCLKIPDIVDQINSNNSVVNPYTNEVLDEDFLHKFKTLYYEKYNNKKEGTPEDIITGTQPSPSPEKELAPGLLDIIIKNVAECENELEDNNLDENGKCPALESSNNDSESESESEGSEGSDSDSDSDSESESNDSTPILSSTPDNWDQLDSSIPGSNNKCVKCNKVITDGSKELKTVRKEGNNNFKTEHYCCTTCLENTSFKKTKDTKKGGRKKTTDK
jgi:hypothetical protein